MRTALLCVAMLLPLHASAVEDTPEAALSSLWRAMSHEAGASADVDTLSQLFHRDAVIFGSRHRDGVPTLRRSSAAEFLDALATPGDKAFHECEVTRTLHVHDRFATVYSVVESREDPRAPTPDFTGVNSVQLHLDGVQWKVISLYYHVEPEDTPLALDGGASGRCLD